jgi:putative ABC transport system permease protein
MRPYALVYFYRRRLRVHLVQELLAGLGIVVAVALVLSTLVAEGSITGSTRRVVQAIVGPAQLQLRSRLQDGFPETTLARVERLAGVKQAAPILEQSATAIGPAGRKTTLELAGTDIALATLDGLARTLPIAAVSKGGVGLTRAAAEQIGLRGGAGTGGGVVLEIRGRRVPMRISAVLGAETAGALSEALVGVMSLAELQSLTGLHGRVTRIIVQAQPGMLAAVRHGLDGIAAGRMQVAPASADVTVLHEALRPSDQASAFFAGVAAVLGLLFAFTAMLLTVPERRRAIADLRLVGTRRGAIAEMVLFQSLVLGVLASAAGVALGYALSRWGLHQSTGYLAEAFTLGSGTVIPLGTVAFAFAGGVAVTVLACALPLADLRRGRRIDAVYTEEDQLAPEGAPLRTHLLLGGAALAVLGVMFAIVAAWPAFALPGSLLIAVATVLCVPLALSGVIATARWLASRFDRLTVLPVALASMRATSLRSLVLAATGGVAIFGSVALGGARGDLLGGIESFAASYTADVPVWVINPDDNQATVTIDSGASAARIAAVPGVARVSALEGGFIDIAARRAWVIARPPGGARDVIASQLSHGSLAEAQRRLAASGWIVISQQILESLHGHIGGSVALPTPSGTAPFRVAATTTNLAWSPGVVFMSSADHRRLWGVSTPTGYAVTPASGASAGEVAGAVRAALGRASGLEVSTAAARRTRIDKLTGEGLGRLGEISRLLSIAAILAMAAALASSVWQRRHALAGLRLAGVKPRRLRAILMCESLLMLGAGCLAGAVMGVIGELIIDGYLRHVTGFPVAPVAVSGRPLAVTAIVLTGALALVALPVWLASRAAPSLALGTQQ